MSPESQKKWKREANCIIANKDLRITRKQILWWQCQIAPNVGINTSDTWHVTMHLHWERSNNSAGDCSINGLSWMGKVPEEIPEVRVPSTLNARMLQDILRTDMTYRKLHSVREEFITKQKRKNNPISFPLFNIRSKSEYWFPAFQNRV